MKKTFLIALTGFVPGAALAHGGHMALAEPAHGALHWGPWTALFLIGVAGALALRRR